MTASLTGFRLDESEADVLVVYEGHMEPTHYGQLFDHWVNRLDDHERAAHPIRFGLLVVHEHHDHDEGDHERDVQAEAELVRLFNEFRRNQRTRVSLACTAYATVYDPNDVVEWYGSVDEGLAQMRESAMRFAQYNFGIPGASFVAEAEARAWLRQQASTSISLPPSNTTQRDGAAPLGSVGLFYGSTTGVTEYVAEQIAAQWQAAGQPPLVPINITHMDADPLRAYDRLILGIPTWNVGELQDDWAILWPQLDDLDLHGKQIALFGVGDARNYPKNFQDAMGYLGVKVRERGGQLVGMWPIAGYDFEASEAVEGDAFMGLALDEVSQSDQTAHRIEQWVEQVITEFALEAALA